MGIVKILITVKTYPTPSKTYNELVCTAGVKEDGSWIRLYPIQFRQKPFSEQYKKYEWIEVDVVKNESDFRPESYRPVSFESKIKVLGKIETVSNWALRKQYVLQNVYTNFDKLVAEAKNKNICTSLATFKPTRIIDFIIKPVKEREWSQNKLDRLNQLNLFENKFDLVKKLPYKFSYRIEDEEHKEHTMMIEDWETGQLFWNCLHKYGDEKIACDKVKEKYYNDFAFTKDLYLFLGTTKVHHYVAPNPFIIIGTFHPKKENQLSLL